MKKAVSNAWVEFLRGIPAEDRLKKNQKSKKVNVMKNQTAVKMIVAD